MSKTVRQTLQYGLSRLKTTRSNIKSELIEIESRKEDLIKKRDTIIHNIKEMEEAINSIEPPFTITFQYTNHADVKEDRTIIPEQLAERTTAYYKERQWLLSGFCLDRQDYRTFAVAGIHSLKIEEDWVTPMDSDVSHVDQLVSLLRRISIEQEW